MHPRSGRKSGVMADIVTRQYAHPNTVSHCLYGFIYLGYTRQELTKIYNKTERTISNWIHFYEATGTYERVRTTVPRKFTHQHRQWLADFYGRRPLAYLDEATAAFKAQFHIDISVPTVWRIIHDFGLTWKVLERRVMHAKENDILRFTEELAAIDWCHANLVFLDEVSLVRFRSQVLSLPSAGSRSSQSGGKTWRKEFSL
jgi:transposase